MYLSSLIVFFPIYLLPAVYGQGGTTIDGDYFVCVPIGFCDNFSPFDPNPGIDPRIVVPSPLCASGTIPCFTQGPGSKCGIRFIEPVKTTDGIADPGAFPWQAYLQNSTHLFAGSGVLIDNYHVLTAAHKVDREEPKNITVIMGVEDPSDMSDVQAIAVSQIFIHPEYDNVTLINDIAVLRVSEPFALSFDNINTACLPPVGGESLFRGQRCMVSGWGQSTFETNDAPTNTKKQVTVDITSSEECINSFSSPELLGDNVNKYLDPAGEICAGGEFMKDACTQDGGSPMVCPDDKFRSVIAGLVIWGKNCGQIGVYGVYVYIPAYREWIDETLDLLNAL